MRISHIVATSRNRVIGKKQKLPWNMPSDAEYFHRVTRGHPVIMGRKNYEANGGALPERMNIVLTRRKAFQPKDAVVVHNIDQAISLIETPEVFIVGGGEIYEQTLNIADRIYLTVIDAILEGDTFYPEINFDDFQVLSKDSHSADSNNPYDWTYYILDKK